MTNPLQAGVDHAELRRLAEALRVSWSDRGWIQAEKIDGLLKEARQAADGILALLNEIDALRAAPVLPDRGWRPIESAPKDGTLVDLWLYWPEGTRHSRCADAFWSEDEGDWKIGQYFTRQYMEPPSALYWMPLPDAPAEGGE